MIYFNNLKSKNYFEGWFFKISQGDFNCALIPSVSIVNGQKKVFIQINLNKFSKKLEYNIDNFYADDFKVCIDGNRFSTDGIFFASDDFAVDVKFGAFLPLENDIMGCFKFGTPCKHKIISMRHSVQGIVTYKGQTIELTDAIGYAEKDWGGSFPSAYCWLQCNSFAEQDAAFFFSAAKMGFPFRGLICSLLIDGREYRFATYNFAKIKKLNNGEIILKKFKYTLKIIFNTANLNYLLAPSRGRMERTVRESLNGAIELSLFDNGRPKHILKGTNVGIEWVKL